MRKDNFMGLAVLVLILLVFLGPFLMFPMVEAKLNDAADNVEAYSILEGATLTWQGRNGYLSLPAGYSDKEAMSIIEALEEIQGVRKVELIVSDDDDSNIDDEVLPAEAGALSGDSEAGDEAGESDESEAGDEAGESDESEAGDEAGESDESEAGDEAGESDKSEAGDEAAESDKSETDDETTDSESTTANVDSTKNESDSADSLEDINGQSSDTLTSFNLELEDILLNNKIEFEYASDELTLVSKNIVHEVSKLLEKYSTINVDVMGHTDSKGDEAFNLGLSELRAESVINELISLGVDSDRLVAIGKGEVEPIATNETDDGRQMNRRVEIIGWEN